MGLIDDSLPPGALAKGSGRQCAGERDKPAMALLAREARPAGSAFVPLPDGNSRAVWERVETMYGQTSKWYQENRRSMAEARSVGRDATSRVRKTSTRHSTVLAGSGNLMRASTAECLR